MKNDITLEEAFWNRKPDISTLQEFSTKCWVLQQDGKNQKLDPKSRPFIFTGLTDKSRAYRYWKPGSRVIQTSRNVIFPQYNTTDSTTDGDDFVSAPTQLKGEKREVEPPLDSDSTVVEIPESKLDTITDMAQPSKPTLPMWKGKLIKPCPKSARSASANLPDYRQLNNLAACLAQRQQITDLPNVERPDHT